MTSKVNVFTVIGDKWVKMAAKGSVSSETFFFFNFDAISQGGSRHKVTFIRFKES